MKFKEKITAYLLSTVLIAIFIAVAVYLLSDVTHVIPTGAFIQLAYTGLAIVSGVVLTKLVVRLLKAELVSVAGPGATERLTFGAEIIGYAVTMAAALTILNVGVESVVLGGAFSGIVLGLAAQTSLSNVFGGVALIMSRPFVTGDRVTVSTWQYGLIAPAYPPKFWSNDFLIPGTTGTVTDISLMYTTIRTDENVEVKLPNNVVIQAAIFVHKAPYRLVRTKYEVMKSFEPEMVIEAIKKKLAGMDFIVGDPAVRVLDTTLNTYIIAVDAQCKGLYEEPPRGEIIKVIIRAVKELESRRSV
jgi:small conductance mechanosensitive channel